MEQHVFVRVGDGKNFNKSMNQKFFGILGNSKELTEGQLLWFVTSDRATGGDGCIIAVARFVSKNARHYANETLGWYKNTDQQDWRYEIKYENIYDLQDFQSEIFKNPYKGRASIHVVKESEQNLIKRLDRLYNAIITLMVPN